MIPTVERSEADNQSNATGFPALRTWRTVYLLVLASFVLWVILLTILPRLFS